MIFGRKTTGRQGKAPELVEGPSRSPVVSRPEVKK